MTAKAKGNTIWRKKLILPAEHGSWAWLLVPFLVGVGVSRQVNVAIWLVLLGSLAAFLGRQPATVWLRIHQGRGRRSDAPLALGWTITFAVIGLFCLLGLIHLGQTAVLWLTLPLLLIFILYLIATQYGRTAMRSLWLELIGAAVLALTAPAAFIVAHNQLSLTAWIIWALMAGQNMLGALYVRLRIADTHQRPINRHNIFLAHLLAFLLILMAATSGLVVWLTAVPFLFLVLRAFWAMRQPRPVTNIKQFGFLELGIELLTGLWIIFTWGVF